MGKIGWVDIVSMSDSDVGLWLGNGWIIKVGYISESLVDPMFEIPHHSATSIADNSLKETLA